MKVLFLGFADLSVDLAKYQADGVSVWTMNDFYHWFPGLKPDMIFEVHRPEMIAHAQRAGRYRGDYKEVYASSGAEIVTRCTLGLDNELDVRQDVLNETFGEKFFVGTFSYMFAWAIQMHVKHVTVEGIHLKAHTEYATQLPGMLHNIYKARQKGIEVNVPGGWEDKWRSLAPTIRENWRGVYGDYLPDTCTCESCIEFRAKFQIKKGDTNG